MKRFCFDQGRFRLSLVVIFYTDTNKFSIVEFTESTEYENNFFFILDIFIKIIRELLIMYEDIFNQKFI